MIIRKWGIQLVRLQKKDIELVRIMRNKEYIRTRMFFQQEITPQQQQHWFNSINNPFNFYFLIYVPDMEPENGEKLKPAGLINGKNIDYKKGECEGGIFLWEKQYWLTPYPLIASIILHDLAFLLIGLNRIFVRVRPDNPTALYFNQKIGFSVLHSDEHQIFMVLDRDSHLKATSQIRHKPPFNNSFLTFDDISFEDETLEDVTLNTFLHLPLEVFLPYARRIIKTVR